MGVSVKMFGLEKIQKLRIQLPGETEEQIEKVEAEFIKFVQKSAKIRAPRFSGQLAESITFKKKNKENWELSIGAPYGWFQEHGFTGEFLSSAMPVAGGYRIGDWMQAKGISGFGFRPSGKPHPFVAPAIEQGLNQIPHMLQNSINNMDIK